MCTTVRFPVLCAGLERWSVALVARFVQRLGSKIFVSNTEAVTGSEEETALAGGTDACIPKANCFFSSCSVRADRKGWVR